MVAVEVVTSGPVQIDSEGLCVPGKNFRDFEHLPRLTQAGTSVLCLAGAWTDV